MTPLTLTINDDGPNRVLKNLGDCTCNVANSGAAEANPIDAGTGNKYQTETDFVGGAATGLSLTRYYNSADTTGSALGSKWHSTWHRGLSITGGGNTVTVTRADGRQDVFTSQGAGIPYLADLDVTSVFRVHSSGWQLTTADDTVEFYTSAGLLSTVTTRAGLVTSLSYDGNNNLTRVTGPFGHTLTFSYDTSNRVSQMTVPDGGVYVYTYDGNNNLASVTHPDNSVRKYVYENTSFPNALTGIIDELGNRFATWAYDSQGRAISSQHAGGVELTTLAYNANGTTTVTDARGNSHSYSFIWEFDIAKPQQVTGAPAPSTGGQAFTYDTNGFIASRTDWDYNVTTYTHDARGDETSRTLGSNNSSIAHTISTTWLSTFHLPKQITDGNRTFSYAYDPHGNLTGETITAPGTRSTWSYTYNASGQVLTARDPRGYVTTYTYDAMGDLTSILNPLGQVTAFTSYDADGRPLSMTDPNGLVTTLVYNWRGEVTSRVATTWVTAYTYDAAGQLIKLTRPDHSYLSFTYDPAHRLTAIADPFGRRIVYTLDASSNRIKEQVLNGSGGQFSTHSFTYDSVNRLLQSIGAQGQTTQYTNDPNGNPTQFADPLGNATTYFYDALNRRIITRDPSSNQAVFGYDPQSRLTSVTDPRGLVTTYSYNGLDEPTAVASPDSGNTTKTYDASGNVHTTTDARGNTTAYGYDALNRLTRAVFADGSVTTYVYDRGVNGVGHLTSMTDTTGTTAWAYEIHGWVGRKVQKNGAVTLTTTWVHDAYGRLARMVYPSGATLTYGYNANGQVEAINYIPAGETVANALLAQIAYRPFGPVNSWVMGNGAAYVRTFDQDGRIARLTLPANDNIALVYDAASRITEIAETGRHAKFFGYDQLNRLQSYTNGPNTEAFQYDIDGNRYYATYSNGASTTNYSYNTDPNSSHLLSVVSSVTENFGYDASGNTTADLIAGSGFAYTYDAKNRLASSVNGPLSLAYGINGFGQRTSKSNTSTGSMTAVHVSLAYDPPQTYFLYDEAGHLIGQYDGTGAAQQETVWLDNLPVATIQAGVAYYIAPDHLGAPHQITDSGKNVVWFWDHDPFGNGAPTGTLTYSLRFPGQFYDPLTGLYNNGFRDYDSATGRYIESDPIGLAGGINTYAYVVENPLSGSDPFGQFCISAGGNTTCDYPGGPRFTVPTPANFPAYLGPDENFYHNYYFPDSFACTNPDDVLQGVINDPAPGNTLPATAQGTSNTATVYGLGNPIISYLTYDQNTGNPLVVNITTGSSFFDLSPGYVARDVSNGAINTYGEGTAWQQAFADPYKAVWGGLDKQIVSKCGCKQ